MSNRFEALCELANKENWCWNLTCTTCGHMFFRYGLKELARGKNPTSAEWIVHNKHPNDLNEKLGSIRTNSKLTLAEQHALLDCASEASLEQIQTTCKFPDWLGYIGLVLHYAGPTESKKHKLTEAFAPQFREMLGETLNEALPSIPAFQENADCALTISDLEELEWALRRKTRNLRPT